MKSRLSNGWPLVLAAALLLLVVALIPLRPNARPSPEEEIQAAWQRAQQAGTYRFATEIFQTTHPAPALLNTGRSSRQDTLHIEGEIRLPDRTLQMTLWQDGGSVLDARDGVEVRVEGDRAYGRQLGGTWEEIPDFSGAFAPGNDLLAYLAGARNVRREEVSAPSALAPGHTRYSFDVDGPAFATHLRDQMERYLIEKGELPAGLTLETSSLYRGVTGEGQIWMDSDGLPLRLSVHLIYPPGENGDQVEAQIQTDFSGFDRGRLLASSPWGRLASALGLPRTPEGWQRLAGQAGLLLFCIGLIALLIVHSRSKRVYAALSVILIWTMVFTPLLQSHQVAAFAQRQAARQAALEQEQEAQAAASDMQDQLLASDWDPLRDPLAAPAVAGQAAGGSGSSTTAGIACTENEKTTDTDKDGLSDCQERQYGTNPSVADTDGDGLLDGWEVLRLGSDPRQADSDGDGIPDGAEVRGFDYAGRRWYLDPNSVDSNNDGRPDTLECPGLGTTSRTCPDTDRDGTPDLFDRDDDGDGVPDRIDTAPTAVVGQTTPFTRERPFELVVNGLKAKPSAPNQYYPVLVDLQLRPVITDHLTYALNVLDWPGGDEDGQVQRRAGNDSTFATYLSAQDAANDPRSANGDMRLIPMLEVELAGKDLPLPLTTTLRTSVQLQGVDTSWPVTTTPPVFTTWLSATVNLSQVGSATRLGFQLQGTTPVTAEIYTGTCNGGVLDVSLGTVLNGQTRDIPNRNLLTLADGAHVLVLKAAGHTAACAPLADVPNGPYTNKMIDAEALRAYGAIARDLGDGRVTLLVPLIVVADETGGGQVAFAARVPYTPHGSSLGAAQKMRVAWLVQMLTDTCRPMPPGSSGTREDWCRYSGSWDLDNTQIVHVYYDDWYLTGLTVREDHGTDVAIAWEDPSAESKQDRQYDDWLWLMAMGLSQTYLTGRDQNGNALRDIGVVTYTDGIRVADTSIAGRFDAPLAPGVTITDRLGVPLTATLQVATFSYPQQDYVAYVMMTETVRILNNNFTAYKDQGADAPTLLFLRDERYRAAELGMGGLTSVSGTRVTFDLGSRPVETLASMSWAPYRYQDGRWQSYPLTDYWNRMYARFYSRFQTLAQSDPTVPADWREDVARGRTTLAQSYYLALMQGRVGLTAQGNKALPTGAPPSDQDVAGDVIGRLEGTRDVLQTISDKVAEPLIETLGPILSGTSLPAGATLRTLTLKEFGASLRRSVSDYIAQLKQLSRLEKSSMIIQYTAAAIAVAFSIAALATSGVTQYALTIVAATSSLVMATISLTETAIKYARGALEPLSKASKIAGIIGTVIAAGVAIGIMIATIVMGPKTPEAIAVAVAAAIGAIIAAVVLLAISLIPVVGQLIVAIIGAIDALVALVCAAAGWEGKYADAFCGGVSGLLARYFTPYGYNTMVDIAEDGRLQFNPFDYTFLRPEQGLAVGNELAFTVTLTNSIQFTTFPPDWKALAWFWQWNEAVLRWSAFAYRWQSTPQDIHQSVDFASQSGLWEKGEWTRRFPFLTHDLYARFSPTGDNAPLLQAGINQPLQLFLAEGYALPAQECIIIPYIPPVLIPVCWVRAEKGTQHTDLGQLFAFDVFPATLDEFYQATPKNGGYSLAWGQAGDVTFSRQRDFDGDGLRNTADGGADPDDSRWDTDGDGLSDLYELQHRSDPARFDTDGDGLDDHAETRLGTDPTRKDTDGDGLTDKEEVDGWEFVYAVDAGGNPIRTWVTSNPLDPDTDGDGLSDAKEKAFGLNPRVVSDPNVLGLEARVAEVGVTHNPNDLIVRGGDTLRYTATVENKLDNRFAQGLFSLNSSASTVLNTAGVPPVQFVLPPRAQTTMSGTLSVPLTSASQPVSLTQVAGALIADWRQQSNFAEMWLRLEESAAATQFVDSSGSLPPHPATCSGATCPTSGVAGYLGSGVRFDGSDDRLVVPDSPGFDFGTGGLAIALWVNKSNTARGTLFSWRNAQDALEIYLDNTTLKVDVGVNGSIATVIANGGTVGLNDWHHVAVVRDAGGTWFTYIDGVVRGYGTSGADLNQIDPGTPIWLGARNNNGAPASALNGALDEVYIFRRALMPEEVAALYGRPVLRLQMEGPHLYADSSGFNNPAICSNPLCPTAPGIAGNAAAFDGKDYLVVASSPSLDLSGGRFTIAAWVYPENTGDSSRDNHTQGIWGRYPGSNGLDFGGNPASTTPTLWRIGNLLRFGFGNGSQWQMCDFPNALTPNDWNHIVLTYNSGQATIYVNSVPKGNCMMTGAPRIDGWFYVGRASHEGTVYIDYLQCQDGGDASAHGEVCGAWNGTEVINLQVKGGNNYDIHKRLNFVESGTLRLWEDDGGTRCGEKPDDGDDVLDGGGWRFDYTMPTILQFSKHYEGDGGGYLHFGKPGVWWGIFNPSIPFRGRVDELIIYRRPLQADEVNELYLSAFAALHLPLDDAPGTNSLENAANLSKQSNATCSGSACPTTGVSGRMNQAALFDGVDDVLNTSLRIEQSSGPAASRGTTLMAWVYPTSASAGFHQVLSSDNGGYDWSLLRIGDRWAVFNGTDTNALVTNANVDVNRWQHIAVVFLPGFGTFFYKNGIRIDHWGTLSYDSSTNPVAVGRNPRGGEYFDGRIDDVRIFNTALSDAEVQRMFRAAPVFQMHLDDPLGATTFADDANGHNGACSGNACPTAGEAIRGQIGTAAAFDGVNDVITVPDNNLLDLSQFTVGAWVMPTNIKTVQQTLLDKDSNYRLFISPRSMTATLSFQSPCGTWRTVNAQAPLMQNQWNHVMATYDGTTARLYVNGYEQGRLAVSGSACVNAQPLRFGSGFAGRLDEVTLHNHALSPFGVRDIFLYQGKWVESRYSHNILVDNDWPFSTLRSYNPAFPYLQNRDYMMHVEAHESTSAIATVELGVSKDGQPYAWRTAPPCLDAAGGAAFCPTFAPSGEGRYLLRTRATDVVSHTEAPTRTYTLYVDGTPPQVGFDSLEANSFLSATLHPSQRNVWVVHLSGTIADPSLPGGYPGSGVQTDTVRVSLSRITRWAGNESTTAPVPPGDQLATVSGNTWTIDYQIWDPQPSGIYSITVQAADRVGNQRATRWEYNYGGNPPVIVPNIFSVDATAPATNLWFGIPAMLTETAWLRGNATDDPVPVVVTYTVGSDSGETGVSIYCGDPAQEIEMLHYAAVYTQPASAEWSGLASRNDYCWVSITNTIGANVVTGTARVCGDPVASWTPSAGDRALIQFDVRSDACGPYYHTAGVCQVQTEFVPNTPGSTYINEPLLAGTALYVPFEDQPDINGTLRFQDQSAQRLIGDCQGAGCPAIGATGHLGNAALFDGQEDSVRFDDFGAFTTTTIAAWVYRTGATSARETIVSYREGGHCGAVLSLNENGRSQRPRFAVNIGGVWQSVQAAQPIWTDVWAYLVGTYDGQTLRLYRDGQLAASVTAPGAMQQCSGDTAIGSRSSQDMHFFPGRIDEVRVLDHALSADEIRALYRGSGPLLALPLDAEWATDGTRPDDISGWVTWVMLNTGAGDRLNKATTGAVGPRALEFDGVDDHIQVYGVDLAHSSFTAAFWARRDSLGQYDLAISQGSRNLDRGLHIGFRDNNRFTCGFYHDDLDTPTAYTDTDWHHWVCTYEAAGRTRTLYRDGVQVAQDTAGAHYQGTGPLYVGRGAWGGDDYDGALDDVHIYPRALSATEIHALAASGWQAAYLIGAGTRLAVWDAQPPPGLEGSYRFDMRGEDCYGLVDTSVRRQGAWRGEVDTLAPRVTITRTTVDGKLRYTATAVDYNLIEGGFSSPCGAGVWTTREPFESPWYVALSGQRPNGNERLYRLTATCDLASVPSLVETGAHDTPGLAQGVAVSGNRACVADGHGGLRVVDISDPQQPRLAGVYPLSWPALAVDVAVAGNYAYLVVDDPAGDRLVVVNVSHPAQPQYAGAYAVAGTELARGIAIGGDNGYVHVPASVSGVWGVLILTADATPAYVNHLPTAGQPRGVAPVGNRLYVTEDGGAMLRIFQMPAATELGHYALPARGWDVAVSGSYAYVAADTAGLQILNVSNPATPTLTAALDTPGLARAVVLSGTQHALVADGVRGLQIVDVAVPWLPQSVGALDTPGHAVDVAHAGGYAYVADESRGLRVVSLQPAPAERVTACDSAGHCVAEALTLPPPAVNASVSILNAPPVLDSLTPFAIRGEAMASVSSLQALTVTVDGGLFYTATWPGGAFTQTLWATPDWTPTEGPHQVAATLATWGGDVAVDVADIIVDTLPPAVIVFPTVLTTTHYHPPLLDLTGLVTDAASLPDVVWQVGSGDWQPAAVVSNVWTGRWLVDGTPDGTPYAVTAQATDIAGHTALVTQTVIVDLTPPAPVTLTLHSAGGILEPGATVREPALVITLTWTASSDGSGIGGYQARWTAQTTATLTTTTTAYGPAARSDPYTAGEGQKVWAYLTSLDVHGNPRDQSIGPVYADSPFTPDYLDPLGPQDVYRGWMASGCSQVGVDRRVNRSALSQAALSAEQRFYVTWNAEALRMVWSGANWNSDGDLFIYLDTGPGGATAAYNPYGAGPAIHLPGVTPTTTVGAMAADYLVWVRDGQTAGLLRWDGSGWTLESDLAQDGLYQYVAGLEGGLTDLHLPFGLLGIGDPAATALDVVAFATEEDALRLWAAMPNGNPLNSARVVGAVSSDAPEFALSYRYHWANLGAGVCPKGSLAPGALQYTDSDLHATLLAEPAGALRGMDAAQLWQWLSLGGDPGDVDWLLGMDESGTLLGEGIVVTFTLRVENRGTVTATGALGDVSSYHALRLPSGAHQPAERRDHQVVNLGDIPPGAEAIQTFTGRIDRLTAQSYYAACAASRPDYACVHYLQRATLQVRLHDDAHPAGGPALERLWSRHLADTQPPEFAGIKQPEYVIAAQNNLLVGYAYDASGVPTVTLTITGPTGLPVQQVCPDATPSDGQWACAWDTTGAADGATYAVSVQATDGFGQAGAWSTPRAFVVDGRPPTVTLDLAASHLDVSNIIGTGDYPLYGAIADHRGLGSLDVCVDGRCAPAQLWLSGGDTAHLYDDEPGTPIAINGSTPCNAPVVRTFVVTESFVLDSVTIGLDIEHARRDDVQAELVSPAGTRVRLLYHSGVVGADRAHYDVLLDDAAATAYPAGGGDDPDVVYYDRPARPDRPLQAFYGEGSAGTWTLSICDLIPAGGDGQYHRSQLRLQPRETAARSGDWTFTVHNDRPMDWVPQTVSLYGEDLVGNRMTTPMTVEVIVDNVPPVITTTQLARSLGLTLTVAALAGTVRDGGGVAGVFVTVWAPEGVYRDAAVLNGNAWRYNLHPISIGMHRLQVTAIDLAGNVATTEEFEVEIRPITYTYLPLVMHRYVSAPDLIVQDIIATPNNIQVVIRNWGNAPVQNEFWVDVYIAPRAEPTRVNQTWDQLGSQGLAWGVTADALPALVPGGTLTLTVGDAYYWPGHSRVSWPLAVGTPIYAQVDSFNPATAYGAVLEDHEMIGEEYNNIEIEEVYALSGAQVISPPSSDRQPLRPGNLPPRPSVWGVERR